MVKLPPFPDVIDSTIRSTWVACSRQFYYSHILNLRRPGPSIHLHFGGCVAKGLEITRKAYWQEGRDEITAIAQGVAALIRQWGDFEIPPAVIGTRSEVKDLSGCIDALTSYFEHHQLGNDVVRPLMLPNPTTGEREAMVEKTFALPIPSTRHPTTSEPLIYAGRFDMLGEFQDAVFVEDDKTALQLGSTWRSNWLLRGQISGYCWGAREFLPPNTNVAGAVIRGIGIMKQSITFETAIVSRPEWQVAQWLRQLTIDANGMVETYKQMVELFAHAPHEAFNQALDAACSAYGGCQYAQLCDSPDPRRWYDEFEVRAWDPLMRESEAA